MAELAADRGTRQFIRETGDNQAGLCILLCAGEALWPERLVDDDQTELAERWRYPERDLMRRKDDIRLFDRDLLALIVTDVVERTIDGHPAALGFPARGFLDDGSDLFRCLDRLQIETHRLGGVELGCLASLPDRHGDPVGHLLARLVCELVRADELEDAMGQAPALGLGNVLAGDCEPELI